MAAFMAFVKFLPSSIFVQCGLQLSYSTSIILQTGGKDGESHGLMAEFPRDAHSLLHHVPQILGLNG